MAVNYRGPSGRTGHVVDGGIVRIEEHFLTKTGGVSLKGDVDQDAVAL